jgi:hypothetical protein
MSEGIKILDVQVAVDVAQRVLDMLKGKVFDVVTYHSAHRFDLTVLEEARLKGDSIDVNNTMVRIFLYPKRSIAFGVAESPVVTFISERRVDIVRKFPNGDTLIRIILINQDGLRLEWMND